MDLTGYHKIRNNIHPSSNRPILRIHGAKLLFLGPRLRLRCYSVSVTMTLFSSVPSLISKSWSLTGLISAENAEMTLGLTTNDPFVGDTN